MLPTNIRRTVNTLSNTPFEAFEDEFNRALSRWWGDGIQRASTGFYPVDIREDQDHLYVEAEMPGFKHDEVDVTIENGLLQIAAERKLEERQGESHLNERRYTRVARSFTLPKTVDENRVDARLENGVLHLTLHKREEVKPRKIEVKNA